MHLRFGDNGWYKALWRLLRSPAFEVIVAIAVVLLAAWVVIQTEVERRSTLFPLLFGHR